MLQERNAVSDELNKRCHIAAEYKLQSQFSQSTAAVQTYYYIQSTVTVQKHYNHSTLSVQSQYRHTTATVQTHYSHSLVSVQTLVSVQPEYSQSTDGIGSSGSCRQRVHLAGTRPCEDEGIEDIDLLFIFPKLFKYVQDFSTSHKRLFWE